MTGGLRDGDSKGQRNLESGWTSATIPKRLAKLSNPFSRVESAGVEPRRAGWDDWGTDNHRPYAGQKDAMMSASLYDLTIAHESNDYFETLTNEYKYPQLEIIYYKAVNAAIKGDTNRAHELLSQLAGEDERLYVVRMGKEFLESK